MAFKITQLAKDMGLKSSKQIVEILTAKGIAANSGKSIEGVEFDMVMEALTRAKQIKDVDAYMFGDTYIPTKAPEKKAKAPATAAEPAKAEALSAPEKAVQKEKAEKDAG